MRQVVQQRTKQKGRGNARGVNRSGAIAQNNANDTNSNCRVEARKRAVGKIAITKSGVGKHAVSHGERNCEDTRNKPA